MTTDRHHDTEILLRVFEESAADYRNFEQQSQRMMTSILFLALAPLGLLVLTRGSLFLGFLAAVILFFLGWFGRGLARTHSEIRANLCLQARRHLENLDQILVLGEPSGKRGILPLPIGHPLDEEYRPQTVDLWLRIHAGLMILAILILFYLPVLLLTTGRVYFTNPFG